MEHTFPELKDRREFYDQIVKDLHNRGLMTTDQLHIGTSRSGMFQSLTTKIGKESEIAYSLVQTFDGCFAMAGETYSNDASEGNVFIVKTLPKSSWCPENNSNTCLTDVSSVKSKIHCLAWFLSKKDCFQQYPVIRLLI